MYVINKYILCMVKSRLFPKLSLENGVFATVVHLLCFHFTLHIALHYSPPQKLSTTLNNLTHSWGSLSNISYYPPTTSPTYKNPMLCITNFTLLNIHFPFWPHTGTYLGIRKLVPISLSTYVYIISIVTKVSYWLEVKRIGFEVLWDLFGVNEW